MTLSSSKNQRRWARNIFIRMGLPAGSLIIIIVLSFYMMYGFQAISFHSAGEKNPELPDHKNAPAGRDAVVLKLKSEENHAS
jgi:hypothetical protein